MINSLPVLLVLSLIAPVHAAGARSVRLVMANSIRPSLQNTTHPMLAPIAQRLLKQKEFTTAQFTALSAAGIETLDDLRSAIGQEIVAPLIAQGVVSEAALMGLRSELEAFEPDLIKAGALDGELIANAFAESLAERAAKANEQAHAMLSEGYHKLRRLEASERVQFADDLQTLFRKNGAILSDENRKRYVEISADVEYVRGEALRSAQTGARVIDDQPGTQDISWMEKAYAASDNPVPAKESVKPLPSGLRSVSNQPVQFNDDLYYFEMQDNFHIFEGPFRAAINGIPEFAASSEPLLEAVSQMRMYLRSLSERKISPEEAMPGFKKFERNLIPALSRYAEILDANPEFKVRVLAIRLFLSRFKQFPNKAPADSVRLGPLVRCAIGLRTLSSRYLPRHP